MASDINELISPEALDSINKLEAIFAKIVTTIDTLVTKSKGLDQLLITMKNLADSQNQLTKATQEVIKINKQVIDSDDEIEKAKIRVTNSIKEHRKELQNEVAMEKAASDSVVAMKAELSNLKTEYNNASSAIRDKMAPALKDLTDKISKAEQATGVHSRGVGNYTNAIRTAVAQIFSIAAPATAAAFALNGLKEAFAGTEQGANLLGRAKIQLKAFFDAIVEGRWRYAFGNELPKDIKEIADLMNQVRINERTQLEMVSAKEKEIKDLRIEAIKAGKDSVKQVELLTLAEQKQDELIDLRVKNKQLELFYINQLLSKDPQNTEYLNKQASLEAEINNILGDRSLRIASKLEAAEEKTLANIEKEKKKREELADKNLKWVERFENDWDEGLAKQSENAEKWVAKFEEDWEKGQVKNAEENLKWVEKFEEDWQKGEEAASKEAIKIKREEYKLTGEIVKEAEQIENNIIDGKIQKLEQQKNDELANTKLTADQKTAINNKYAKEEASLKRKAAQIEKVEGIFSIAISTAKNIAAASNPAMMVMIPWIIAQGIAEAAVVASKPLPSYEKGTHYASGGPSVISEKGREIIISPSGDISLSPDDPTIMNIERGSKIIPSDETKRIIESAKMTKRNDFEAVTERRHKELINTIKNKRELIISSSTGHYITERTGDTYKEYFKRHLQ